MEFTAWITNRLQCKHQSSQWRYICLFLFYQVLCIEQLFQQFPCLPLLYSQCDLNYSHVTSVQRPTQTNIKLININIQPGLGHPGSLAGFNIASRLILMVSPDIPQTGNRLFQSQSVELFNFTNLALLRVKVHLLSWVGCLVVWWLSVCFVHICLSNFVLHTCTTVFWYFPHCQRNAYTVHSHWCTTIF